MIGSAYRPLRVGRAVPQREQASLRANALSSHDSGTAPRSWIMLASFHDGRTRSRPHLAQVMTT